MDLLKAVINLLKPVIHLSPNLCFNLDHFILWSTFNDGPNTIYCTSAYTICEGRVAAYHHAHDRDFVRPNYYLNFDYLWEYSHLGNYGKVAQPTLDENIHCLLPKHVRQ